MRITFHFYSNNPIILPINYNELLQGMIYRYLEKDFATFLHEDGYPSNGRSFKLFCFSQISSKTRPFIDKEHHRINFGTKIEFNLSTIIDKIAISFVENQMTTNDLFLGQNKLKLESIQVHIQKQLNSKTEIKLLSPMTEYSTLHNKKTHYYNPLDMEFSSLILKNLLTKMNAYLANQNLNPLSENIEKSEFSIKPLHFDVKRNKVLTRFKDHIIEAYNGIFELSGHPDLINFAYHTGLGSKNSMGFGYWDIYHV